MLYTEAHIWRSSSSSWADDIHFLKHMIHRDKPLKICTNLQFIYKISVFQSVLQLIISSPHSSQFQNAQKVFHSFFVLQTPVTRRDVQLTRMLNVKQTTVVGVMLSSLSMTRKSIVLHHWIQVRTVYFYFFFYLILFLKWLLRISSTIISLDSKKDSFFIFT